MYFKYILSYKILKYRFMNKSFLSLLISGCVLCVVSCQKISNDESAALKQENDSLMLVNAQTKAEFEEVLMLINEIQAGFNEIKSAENYIVVNNNIFIPSVPYSRHNRCQDESSAGQECGVSVPCAQRL